MADIIHSKGEAGGYLVGKRHTEGGIKAINKSTGQPLEMEGGEVVITRNAVSDSTKRSFNGKMMTNREILSSINKSGGGVEFAEGGELPATIDFVEAVIQYEGETVDASKVLEKMAFGGQVSDILDGFDIDTALDSGTNYAVGGRTRRVKAKVDGILNLKVPLVGVSGKPKLNFEFKDLPLNFFAYGVYFNAGAVSAVVKQLCKREIPYQKVSVSSSVFSGGDSIDIWPDDPKGWVTPEAYAFAKTLEDNFRGGRFDGMTDSYNYSSTNSQFVVKRINEKDFDEYYKSINESRPVRELEVSVSYFTVNKKPKYGTKAYDEFENRLEAEPEQELVEIEPLVPSPPTIEILEDEAPRETFVNPDSDSETEMAKILKFIDELQFLIDVTPDYQFEKKAELGSRLAGLYNEYNLLSAKQNKSLFNGALGSEKTFQTLMNMVLVDADIADKIERNPNYSQVVKYAVETIYDNKSGSYEERESFINWFGNFEMNKRAKAMVISQSKVYDDNYFPKKVYHGLKTLKDQFRTFKFPTTYFAVNKKYAEYFSTARGGDGYVIPFYLNVRNPLDLTPFGITKVKPTDFMDYMFLKTMMSPKELGFPDALLEDGVPPLEVWVYLRRFPKFVEAIKNTKLFDGFHFFENNPAVPEDSESYETEVWTTFYPNQSKAIYFRRKNKSEDVIGQNNSMWFNKGGQL